MPLSRKMTSIRRMTVYVVTSAFLLGTAAATAASGSPAHTASEATSGSVPSGSAPSGSAPVAFQTDQRGQQGNGKGSKDQHKKARIPCATPDTTGAVAKSNAAADKAAASGNAWTGVLERVFVDLHSNGSVSGTPRQRTRVSASGTSPVTVKVPVSGQVSHRRKAGKGTPVVDHQAHVKLSPSGTSEKLVETRFNRPLPVKVSIKYQLDGKPISADKISGKRGTVKVAYTLSNVSARRMSACFEGFDGAQQHITLQTPLPIFAWLYFTVPSQATTFSAPGSSLSPDNKGVSVGWTVPLFEPFGPKKRTFTLTMKTSQATIPAATLWLETVSPFTLTGQAPAASAQALGTAAAAVAQGQSAVQSTLDAVQRAATSLQTTTSSNAGRSPSHRSRGRSGPGDPGVLSKLVASLGTDLGSLRASLDKQSSDAVGATSSARVTAGLAATIKTLAVRIATHANALSAQQSVAVQAAAAEVQQLEQLSAELQALPPDVQSAPPVQRLASDLAIARATADKVSSAVTDAQQLGQSVTGDLAELKGNAAALVARAVGLQAAATAMAERARTSVAQHLHAADSHLAKFQDRVTAFQAHFTSLQSRVAELAASIRTKFESAKATARQDLANLLLRGEAALQVAADQAQAQLAQAQAETQSDVAKANEQYANLLTLDQQAVLFQVPGGTVSNVSEQAGVYYYNIGGTSAKTQRQDTRQNRREQRQSTRQHRREQRQSTRQNRRHDRQSTRQHRREQRQSTR